MVKHKLIKVSSSGIYKKELTHISLGLHSGDIISCDFEKIVKVTSIVKSHQINS